MSETSTKSKAKPAKKPSSAQRKSDGALRNSTKLAPHLTCRNAVEAIDFYKRAFGAEELMRLPGPDGRLMHAAVSINGAMVMLNDEMPEHGALSPLALKGTPVTLHLNVADVDKAFARAVDAGATVTMPVADMFWGDRYGIVTDPFGHSWSLATHQKDMTVDEIKSALNAMGDPGCAEVAEPARA